MRLNFPSPDVLRPRPYFSRWDLIVIPFVPVAIALITIAVRGASVPFDPSTPDLTVSLDPINLPYYALRTMFRMFVAVLLSLAFTFTIATLAAKSRRAERVIIPVLDFLQSLPILGFLTVTTAIFLGVFRGSLLALEAAAVFAIFTSQVWNMAFSFYHSLITTPRELVEAAAAFRLSGWQKFWKLEVPYATPGLLWNTMMSVSGGWFFVVASEFISVVGRDNGQALPGVGSYIRRATDEANVGAMALAAVTVFALVLVYDQLFFRPIVAWSEKFKFEQSASQEMPRSWMLSLLRQARLVQRVASLPAPLFERLSLATSLRDRPSKPMATSERRRGQTLDRAWTAVIAIAALALLYLLAAFMFGPDLGVQQGTVLAPNPNLNPNRDPAVAQSFQAAGVAVGADQTVYLSAVCAATANGTALSPALAGVLDVDAAQASQELATECATPMAPAGKVSLPEVGEVARLGLLTALRVVGMIAIATLIWTPIGVWVGLRPRAAQAVQPFIQFAAAFPANLLYPIGVVLITRLALNPEVWLSPLMVMGTQWYILFNVTAGAIAIPNDLKEAGRVLGLRQWARWRTLILPAIFPSFVTGGITAAGGSWNASIVAELVSWGTITLVATGLGSYIARWSTGEFNPHVALGMLVMGLIVLVFNRLLWRRLYRLAEERFRLD
jgi:NitT/TauT family transport system permease protein